LKEPVIRNLSDFDSLIVAGALSREEGKKKAISIGVTHVQPTEQAVHRGHFGKELEANCEIQSNFQGEKEC
jgi:hypothetical protein